MIALQSGLKYSKNKSIQLGFELIEYDIIILQKKLIPSSIFSPLSYTWAPFPSELSTTFYSCQS